MKTIKKTIYALMGAAILLSFASCSQDNNILDGIEEVAVDPVTDNTDKVIVTFEMGGEITASESALTRGEGSTDDLYGIIIYKNGVCEAKGLFDNVSNIQYAMSKNSNYSIIVTLAKNGKNIIYYNSTNAYDSKYFKKEKGYLHPFGTFSQYVKDNGGSSFTNFAYIIGAEITNSFVTSGNLSEESFKSGKINYAERSLYYYPIIDRFYGKLDITPSEDCTVTLPLKRTAFGLRYQVSGITDGTVSVTINKAWNEDGSNKNEVFFSDSGIAPPYYNSEEKIISFKDVYDAWAYADNYTDEVTVSIQWARGVGVTEDLGTKTIRVKRNRMNTININLSANDGSAGLSLVMDDLIFSNETANIHVE